MSDTALKQVQALGTKRNPFITECSFRAWGYWYVTPFVNNGQSMTSIVPETKLEHAPILINGHDVLAL